jgi:methionyl-tRNA formyltransferase
MRVVFMGSAELACPSFEALMGLPGVEVVGVVTQPDRPKGRSLKVSPCAAGAAAAGTGIPILTPVRVNTPAALQTIRELQPDLIVVVAYGQILRPELLALPPLGCINVHTSLLPEYRGAAPIQWAVARGETETGVTIMYMNEGMDEGDIILQVPECIRVDDTAGTLHDRLAVAGAGALLRAIDELQAGTITRRPQDADAVTYAPKLKKADGRIDWTQPAATIRNRVRGFNPWPCCHCRVVSGERTGLLKVLEVRVDDAAGDAGQVVAVTPDGPTVATGEGAVRLLRVQPEGKRVMSGADYVHGYRLAVGDQLG